MAEIGNPGLSKIKFCTRYSLLLSKKDTSAKLAVMRLGAIQILVSQLRKHQLYNKMYNGMYNKTDREVTQLAHKLAKPLVH